MNTVQNALKNIIEDNPDYRVTDKYVEELGNRGLIENSAVDVEDFAFANSQGLFEDEESSADDRTIFEFDEEVSREIADVVSSYHTTWYTYIIRYDVKESERKFVGHASAGGTQTKSTFAVNKAHQLVVDIEREILVRLLKSLEDGDLLELINQSSPSVLAVTEVGKELEMTLKMEKLEQEILHQQGSNRTYNLSGHDPVRTAGFLLFSCGVLFTLCLFQGVKHKRKEEQRQEIWGNVLANDESLNFVLEAGKIEVMTDGYTESNTTGSRMHTGVPCFSQSSIPLLGIER